MYSRLAISLAMLRDCIVLDLFVESILISDSLVTELLAQPRADLTGAKLVQCLHFFVYCIFVLLKYEGPGGLPVVSAWKCMKLMLILCL